MLKIWFEEGEGGRERETIGEVCWEYGVRGTIQTCPPSSKFAHEESRIISDFLIAIRHLRNFIERHPLEISNYRPFIPMYQRIPT